MKQFKLDCTDVNPAHVRFRVIDHLGAVCGQITVRTQDAGEFVAANWNGGVYWNDKQLPATTEKEAR